MLPLLSPSLLPCSCVVAAFAELQIGQAMAAERTRHVAREQKLEKRALTAELRERQLLETLAAAENCAAGSSYPVQDRLAVAYPDNKASEGLWLASTHLHDSRGITPRDYSAFSTRFNSIAAGGDSQQVARQCTVYSSGCIAVAVA